MTDVLAFEDRAVLASRLRAARRAAGKTQQEVADRIGAARTTIVAIEKGERAVRSEELVALSDFFDRPINVLVRSAPVDEDFVAEFRSTTDRNRLGAAMLDAVSLLQALADDYVELERISGSPLPQHYPPEQPMSGLKPADAGEALAAAERNRLGLGDGPVLGLRQILESDVGLRVFGLDLPGQVSGLFMGSAVYGGCVVFNVNHPFERQRWTMAHEHGHFLAHRLGPEVTFEDRKRLPARERLADAFAANFLMPAAGLKRRFNEIKQSRSGRATVADLVHLADRYRVSVEAMNWRLESLSLARRGTRSCLREERFKVGEARNELGIEKRPPDEEMLPLRYRCLAVEAYLRAEISEGQLVQFLRVDRVRARQIVARFEEVSANEPLLADAAG